MSIEQLQKLAPLDSPLPPLVEGEALNADQWTTLLAIGDTIIPSIQSSSSESTTALSLQASEYTTHVESLKQIASRDLDASVVHSYLAENITSYELNKELVQRTLIAYLPSDALSGLQTVLTALGSRPGNLLLTGSITPFHLQPINVRQQILLNWSNSYLPPLRAVFKSFTFLFKQVWLKTSPTFAKMVGFPRVPVHGTQGQGFNYNFIQFPPGDETETIETDVLIIGSGCGGAVCAKNLAEAGHRVLVVEKAFHFPPEHLPMTQVEGSIHLFENGGAELSDDGSMTILSGSAWGGGGTVNWSASLQTQNYVRQEWADGGLPFFTSAEFQNSLDRVYERMGASTEFVEHNKTNRVLFEGARKLGYNCKAVPQNTGGKQHYCGYCTLGCGSAEKQGPVVSWLPDAARAGATFLEGFRAEKITFQKIAGKEVAIGVTGNWTSRDSHGGVSGTDKYMRRVTIKAKKTIVSCGSLQSPLLLQRSGLTNPQIGRNLHLHPVCVLLGVFSEEIRPWEGGILTAVVDSLQDMDGHGHGPKLEAVTMIPAFVLPLLPWSSGPEFKETVAKFKDMCGFISLARDRDSGRVYSDKDGRTRIAYNTSALDRKHVLEGVIALAKIAYVGGAKEIYHSVPGVPVFIRGAAGAESASNNASDAGINDPAFQSWLSQVRKRGLPDPDTTFCSAHQMGSCRMGASERSSVVNDRGKVWGTEGLYVADASVFPSASGVNPMVTNMAISDWTSRSLVREMREESRLEERREGARL